ncbi:hypothetical protein Taro_007000 [Colocasia esculenta]|uniref:Uncharacterized protein n=1 Tax=Colocasia esculenta TaxID=4460 RepID=A0A843TZ24_COLES|nr:hypothetical protein [Colocasia esculenta]
MASRTEGIALLSMYNDEEEEEEDAEEAERGGGGEARAAEEEASDRAEDDLKVADDGALPGAESAPEKTPLAPQSWTPVLPDEDLEQKTLASPALPTVPTPTRTPTPKHQFLLPSMPSQSPVPAASPADAAEIRRASKRSLTIVDYAHDETALSPETEGPAEPNQQKLGKGELPVIFKGTFSDIFVMAMKKVEGLPSGGQKKGRGVFSVFVFTGIVEERTSVTVLMVTSSTQPTPPRLVEQPEESRSEANTPADVLETDQEALPVDMDVEVSATVQEDLDPLSKFLPPQITVKCSEELQVFLPPF